MSGMTRPSVEQWLQEAKTLPAADECGMYLVHNGIVRRTAREQVRNGAADTAPVVSMDFSYDREKLREILSAAQELPGIFHVRVWLNEGQLDVGEDIMQVLVGGDIRPHVIAALEYLVGRIKSECVVERERYGS